MNAINSKQFQFHEAIIYIWNKEQVLDSHKFDDCSILWTGCEVFPLHLSLQAESKEIQKKIRNL